MRFSIAAAAALLVSALVSSPASAAIFMFDLSGSGITASITLTYAANPNTGPIPGTSPNPVDPIGSYIVTGISGTFSDANIGIGNTAITGIVTSNPANPQPTNLLAPASFGFYAIASGVPSPEGIAPGFSYDNLFYPGGSPQAATDYPFHGGILDIYGIVFTLADGNAVNLWSNGDFGGGAQYGVGVTDGLTVLDYSSPVDLVPGVVPEPSTWALMVLGFGATGFALRRGRRTPLGQAAVAGSRV